MKANYSAVNFTSPGIAIKILCSSVFAILAVVVGTCFAADSETLEARWRELSKQYVLADTKLLQMEEKKRKGIPEQLDLRDELRAELAQAPQPSIEEIKSLLNSAELLDRKTALVTAFVKQITSPDIIATILTRYEGERDFFIRFYSHHVLMNLSDDQVKSVQADILRISRSEQYETNLITSLPTILRLGSDAVIPLLTEYFIKGSPGLKRATYATLRASHPSYLKDIRSILKRDKAKSALAFIEKLDTL